MESQQRLKGKDIVRVSLIFNNLEPISKLEIFRLDEARAFQKKAQFTRSK